MFNLSRLAPLTLGLLLLAGCGAAGAASPRPLASSPTPLLTVERHGGLCPEGLCKRVVRIDSDGTITELVPRHAVLGQLAHGVVDALAVEVSRADFAVIERRPFLGVCPMAYDGQETVYTFHLPTGDEVVASCKVEIQPTDPLFRTADAVLAIIDR